MRPQLSQNGFQNLKGLLMEGYPSSAKRRGACESQHQAQRPTCLPLSKIIVLARNADLTTTCPAEKARPLPGRGGPLPENAFCRFLSELFFTSYAVKRPGLTMYQFPEFRPREFVAGRLHARMMLCCSRILSASATP